MMKRLTEKDKLMAAVHYENEDETKAKERDLRCAIYNKCKEVEDIEEELGIDLKTLMLALRDGISYTAKNGRKGYYLGWELYFDYNNQCFRNLHEGREYDPSCDAYDGTGWYELDDCFDFCDFGKSWEILTREMYENIRKGKC